MSRTHASGPHATPVPWLRLLINPSLLALCLMYFLINYGWFFNITYLPSYLQDRFAIAPDDMVGAIYKGAPLWVGAVGCICGGFAAEFLGVKLGSRAAGRRALGVIGMLGCAACWGGALLATNIHMFCLCTSLAAFFVDITLGACWASCQDIGRSHAATAAAMMNMIGTFGAALTSWLTGTIVERSVAQAARLQDVAVKELSDADQLTARLAGFSAVFAAYSVIYVIAAICWLGVRPEKTALLREVDE